MDLYMSELAYSTMIANKFILFIMWIEMILLCICSMTMFLCDGNTIYVHISKSTYIIEKKVSNMHFKPI